MNDQSPGVEDLAVIGCQSIEPQVTLAGFLGARLRSFLREREGPAGLFCDELAMCCLDMTWYGLLQYDEGTMVIVDYGCGKVKSFRQKKSSFTSPFDDTVFKWLDHVH